MYHAEMQVTKRHDLLVKTLGQRLHSQCFQLKIESYVAPSGLQYTDTTRTIRGTWIHQILKNYNRPKRDASWVRL